MEKFSDIDAWVFDLDNTLYPAQHNLFAQVDKRMTAFIQDALSVSREEAYRLQKDYLRDYGTTLAGLMNPNTMATDAALYFLNHIYVMAQPPDPTTRHTLDALSRRNFTINN